MSNTLRGIFIVCIVFYFIILYYLLKKKRLILKYTLLWLLTGVSMGILVIFPNLLTLFSELCGIELPVNALFTFAFVFVAMLLMALTSIVSKQSNRIKDLVQDNALMEKRIRELEKILVDKNF